MMESIRNIKKFFIIIVAVGLFSLINCTSIYAQILPEWKSTISTGTTIQEGNTDNVIGNIRIKTERKTNVNKFKLGTEYFYGETNNKKDEERLLCFQEFEQLIAGPFFYILNSSFKYDLNNNLDRRILLNPGLGIYLIKNNTTLLSFDGGITYQVEKYKTKTLNDEIICTARQRFETKFSEKINIFEKIEYFPDLEDIEKYRIEGEFEIEVKLFADLSMNLLFRDYYNNRPESGKEHNDINIITGISYAF